MFGQMLNKKSQKSVKNRKKKRDLNLDYIFNPKNIKKKRRHYRTPLSAGCI